MTEHFGPIRAVDGAIPQPTEIFEVPSCVTIRLYQEARIGIDRYMAHVANEMAIRKGIRAEPRAIPRGTE